MKKLSVLILASHEDAMGGVAGYYRLFYKHFQSPSVEIKKCNVGRRPNKNGLLQTILYTCSDIFKILTIIPKYDIIQINLSLGWLRGILRDGFYHFIAKRIFRRKTIVFFHGWDLAREKSIKGIYLKIFKYAFNFDKAIVLANRFKQTLVKWNYSSQRIALETTAYEATPNIVKARSKIRNILFLARFSPDKGCLLTLKIVERLVSKDKNYHLFMAGDGELYDELVKYTEFKKLERYVTFTGYVHDQQKYDLLNMCDLLVLPTTHGEGIPVSIVESMAFGLAIITRPVGGIVDILKSGKNGFMLKSLNPEDYANFIENLNRDTDLLFQISKNNIDYARSRFEIKQIIHRFEQYYLEFLPIRKHSEWYIRESKYNLK